MSGNSSMLNTGPYDVGQSKAKTAFPFITANSNITAQSSTSFPQDSTNHKQTHGMSYPIDNQLTFTQNTQQHAIQSNAIESIQNASSASNSQPIVNRLAEGRVKSLAAVFGSMGNSTSNNNNSRLSNGTNEQRKTLHSTFNVNASTSNSNGNISTSNHRLCQHQNSVHQSFPLDIHSCYPNCCHLNLN